ncbi:tripartite tricarboxylate transporter TctB family protein [Evansella halocellulosilytica]|uniref:tripartite tricarboxylate transporter TctB family protein n=1 Tax=Evansella halocellulosilytica TaxID=2011013 RepID=UPI000BB6B63F|nr:tripartite tricarboxylate transporter TctB family protein [Evansella halocellulosilytica]
MRGKYSIQIVMILLGLFFFITAFQISVRGFQGDVLNQREYVIVLSILLIGLAVASIVKEKIGSKQSNEVIREAEETMEVPEIEKEDEVVTPSESRSKLTLIVDKYRIYIAMILVVLFAYGFAYVGFFVTSFVFVFLFTWMVYRFDRGKILNSFTFSVVLNVILYFLFDLISVYLPNAWLF